MAVEIYRDSGNGKCVFVDNTSMQAFGPVMNDLTEAEAFLDWLGAADPRVMGPALTTAYDEFVSEMARSRG